MGPKDSNQDGAGAYDCRRCGSRVLKSSQVESNQVRSQESSAQVKSSQVKSSQVKLQESSAGNSREQFARRGVGRRVGQPTSLTALEARCKV